MLVAISSACPLPRARKASLVRSVLGRLREGDTDEAIRRLCASLTQLAAT